MATTAVQAIKSEIDRKQAEVDALKAALAAMNGGPAPTSRGGQGTRRPRTAAEKQALSKAMKAAWRRRKAEKEATPAKSRKTAGKKAVGKKTAAKKTAQAARPAAS